ncbi:hypothetical protein ABPG74_020517 [Tetrahymena malaccensis]
MGCVQDKNQSQVLVYENSMGEHFSTISGKDVQNIQVVVMGVTQENEQRIFAYDALTQKFKALLVPQGMTIWNYSCLVHLSNKEIFITGGLSSSASEISSQAYIYDSINNRAIRLPNMICPRYTHISIFFKGKLYAIGGRDYGDDDDSAIRSQCERFNFFIHKWEKISKLNIPRCTGFSFIYKGSLYVCGGLTGKMHRSRAIERYDESNDRWVLLDFKLSRGLECGSLFSAAHFLPPAQAKDKFIIVGGNTEEGSQDTMYIYSMSEKTVLGGPCMNQKRVLQKAIAYNNKVHIFGGSETDGVEVYDQSANNWKEDKLQTFSLFVSPQDIDLFSYSQPPVTIPDEIPLSSKIHQSNIQQQNQSNITQEVQQNGVIQYNINVDKAKEEDENQNGKVLSSNDLKRSNLKPEDKKFHIETELSPIAKSLIKEDLIVEKSYLFGTDIDPFILEIDFLNAKIEKKSVPLQIRLFQYQSAVAVKQMNLILLMGGVHDGMNKTVNYTYTLDVEKFVGKRLENMIVGAYAFATLVIYPYIYAIGGKQSTDLSQSNSTYPVILNSTQRFNLETMKWEKLPNLNVKRVSAMVTNFSNKIYVFGGFKGDMEQVRPNEIEVYNQHSPAKDSKGQPIWEVISVKFPIGLEGAPLLKVNILNQERPDIILFGGRTSSGEIKYISKLSLEIDQSQDQKQTENEEEEEENEEEPQLSLKLDKLNQMIQSRCLHKVIQPYKNFVLVLGGQLEPYVECVDVSKNYASAALSQVPHIDLMAKTLCSFIKKLKDHTLKQCSFTYL